MKQSDNFGLKNQAGSYNVSISCCVFFRQLIKMTWTFLLISKFGTDNFLPTQICAFNKIYSRNCSVNYFKFRPDDSIKVSLKGARFEKLLGFARSQSFGVPVQSDVFRPSFLWLNIRATFYESFSQLFHKFLFFLRDSFLIKIINIIKIACESCSRGVCKN